MWVGVALGVVGMVAVMVAAVRGQRVPVYAAVLGPLVLLVSVRIAVSGWLHTVEPSAMQEGYARVAPVGDLAVVSGVLLWLAGLIGRRTGQGAPAVSQVGAATAAVGLLWGPWARAQALLWGAWHGPASSLSVVHEAAVSTLHQGLWWSAGTLVLLYTPVALWGLWRERWIGLGEGAAAVVVMLLVLRTGQPLREATAAHDHALAGCEAGVLTDVDPLALQNHPVMVAARCRAQSSDEAVAP